MIQDGQTKEYSRILYERHFTFINMQATNGREAESARGLSSTTSFC